MNTTAFITLDALAVELGLPRRYLRELVEAGRIPFLLSGQRRFFDAATVREALCRLAESGQVTPAKQSAAKGEGVTHGH